MSAYRYAVVRGDAIASIHDTLAEAKREQRLGGVVAKTRDDIRVGDAFAPPETRAPGRPPTGAAMTVRLSGEDRLRLEQVRRREGLSTDAEAIRWAIRRAAD